MVEVLCVSVGEAFDAVYVERLAAMLDRRMGQPLRLRCLTDQPGRLPRSVEPIDASAWGLSGWFNKLRLFDQATTGPEPFLYLDLSVVLWSDLSPLLDAGRRSPAPVTAVRDWHYDSVNTCCMWIEPGAVAQKVWDAYAAGVRYETRLDSDQDFVNAVLRPLDGSLAYFPEGMVVSYKKLRNLHRRDPRAAADQLARATVLKFHGQPKPHQLLSVRDSLRLAAKTALRHPRHVACDWGYLRDEVRRRWTLPNG